MSKRFKKIYIEITNVCNLNCSFCPKTKRKLSFMSFDIFKKAVLESLPLSDEITLHIMGEPLLHPKIKEFVLFAERSGVRINLTTNGTVIDSSLLLNSSFRRINFSIHGLKNNFSFEDQKKYLINIINFTKLAQEVREDLIIIYRLWNINDESNKDIIRFIEQEFDVVLSEEISKTSIKIKNNSYIHFDNSFEWPDPTNSIRSNLGYCHGLFTHIGILVDGTVVPCCLDNDGLIPLGNILTSSLVDILGNSRASAMKKGFQERKLVEDLCKKCTFIKRLERNRDNV